MKCFFSRFVAVLVVSPLVHIPAILVGLLLIFIDVRKPKSNTTNEVTS